jgi:DNA-binding transcriptional MocR family regulator
MQKKNWVPDLSQTDGPQYIALAQAIADDIASGVLLPGDQLPPQRRVAKALGMDVSAISRGYAEAVRRGYVTAHVGKGTFVRDPNEDLIMPDPRRTREEDPRMNMPPEPEDPELKARMQAGLAHVAANIVPLLRYQTATGSAKDREIALDWMQTNGVQCNPDLLAIAPGAHAAIDAALRVSAGPETVVLCENVTYPGIRAIAASQGLRLVGLTEDAAGVTPGALEQAFMEHRDVVLYLNPTLRNPTTHTIPASRRKELGTIIERHGIPFIEDDAYQFIATRAPAPISSHVPHLSWHILGVSKIFGAGLRVAYTQVPDQSKLGAFVQTIRASQVMTNPLSLALLSTWLEDGTANDLQAFVRRAVRERQTMVEELLPDHAFKTDPDAFNIWLQLPKGTSRADVIGRMARQPLGLVPAEVFTLSPDVPEALRVCLGGPIDTNGLRKALMELNGALVPSFWTA